AGHHHPVRPGRGHRLITDRHHQRDHRSEGEVLMAVEAVPPPEPARTRAGGSTRAGRILRGIARPYRTAHGVGRFMLVTGTILAGLMVLLALFAPLIAPYGFAQVADAEGARFANHAPPGGEHWLGTSTQGRSEERRVGKEGRHRGRRAAAAV